MEADEIIKDLRESTLEDMKQKNKELFDAIRPINGGMILHGGKPSYKDSMKFVRDDGFRKAYYLLFEIIKSHSYLAQFY